MLTVALVLIAALGIVAGALFSGLETGLYCLNRVRLRLRADHGEIAARAIARLVERQEDAVVTTFVGATVADYAVSAALSALFLSLAFSRTAAEVYTTLVAAPIVFTLASAVPKNLFRRQPEGLVYPLWLPLTACTAVVRATGVLWLVRALTRAVARRLDPGGGSVEAGLPRARMLTLLREGALVGGLSPEQREMMERVLVLRDLRVARVMIARARAVIVPKSISRDDFLRIARMAHFSRVPVHGENKADVVGIVNVYDVIADESELPVARLMRPPLFVNQAEPVSNVLLKMQSARQAMAIVVNARRECVGIVTVKDLVEEIVGDLSAW